MTTQQDVVSAWNSVLKAADELHAYLQSMPFVFNRKRFDELVEKHGQVYAEYVRLLTDFANKSR
jgi:hypothetical protein